MAYQGEGYGALYAARFVVLGSAQVALQAAEAKYT